MAHELSFDGLPHWKNDFYGRLFGRCSCGMTWQGHTEEDIRTKHSQHKNKYFPDPTVCTFCGGPAPCLKEE